MYQSTEPLKLEPDLIIDGVIVAEINGRVGFKTSGYTVFLVENPAAGQRLSSVRIGRKYKVSLLDMDPNTHIACAYPLDESQAIGTPEEFAEVSRLAREGARGIAEEIIAALEHRLLGGIYVRR